MTEQTSEVMDDLMQEEESIFDGTEEFALDDDGEVQEELELEMPAEPASEEALIAKYNGQEYQLDRQAAQTIAQSLGMDTEAYIATLQKGMNYDKVSTRVQELENSRERALLARAASLNGMDYDQFIDTLNRELEDSVINREAEQVTDKYPDLPDDVAREMAENNLRLRRIEQAEQIKRQQQAAKDAQLKPWREFYRAYPGLKPQDIPREIYPLVEAGEHPVAAMRALENRQLQARLQALETNNKNKEMAIGSIKSAGEDFNDDFLAGFNSI